jgi:hypothetical protein
MDFILLDYTRNVIYSFCKNYKFKQQVVNILINFNQSLVLYSSN